ncbi:hypothetical protein GIB67_034442 [Kingdonia uniflora]|uniref:LEC14B homolog n=1 Tax=Kingdonia uniflora TaxID=39325 RepID=A0A7J7PB67_9MAGN|nr:hypothetical protein GIB67_034442 [Kingdonia uniflora]
MGFAMSRPEMEFDDCDIPEIKDGASASSRGNKPLLHLDHEVAQLTKLRSGPHERLSKDVPGRRESNVSVVKMLAGREYNFSRRGRFSAADRCHVLSRYLPINGPWKVDKMNSRAYVSQFSADGSLFVAGFQGSHIRIYDVENEWKVQKDILAKSVRWTITDTSLSPDQRKLVYASMSPTVYIVNVGSSATESVANVNEIHDGLDFSFDDDGEYSFGIFSVKFSNDGRELVAGSSDNSIYVYDLETNKVSLRIAAHTSDVNTVCFADDTGHLIYSGGDDNLCKVISVLWLMNLVIQRLNNETLSPSSNLSNHHCFVVEVWDRRCFVARGKPAGVLAGHLEGITFLDSRGDGRYLISNGKDQTLKLWDIRRMSSNATCSAKFRNYDWDYRWMAYPVEAVHLKHPGDQSLASYSGHAVLRTLIRCYFSPAYSTGQKYIYTGSNDSGVYIYDLVSGAPVARLDHHESTVRDCSWHPFYPMLVSSSWDGVIARWEFPGNGKAPSLVRHRKSRRPQGY